MYETAEETRQLQELLDRSHSGASQHLRSIFKADRTLRAGELVGLLTGMRTLSVATVTARGEPRISAVDGHFLHAQWIFSTSRSSAKAAHIHRQPAVSASYLEGEELGIFAHGRASTILESEPDFEATLDHLTEHYGSSPLSWGDTALYRMVPTWIVGYAFRRDDLLAARGVEREPRDEDVT
jgi:pyridoxamine 5'-phosphate oxidase-like protein